MIKITKKNGIYNINIEGGSEITFLWRIIFAKNINLSGKIKILDGANIG